MSLRLTRHGGDLRCVGVRLLIHNFLESTVCVINSLLHIITEHGLAELRGRTLQERAKAMIGLADPEHRAELRAAVERDGLV